MILKDKKKILKIKIEKDKLSNKNHLDYNRKKFMSINNMKICKKHSDNLNNKWKKKLKVKNKIFKLDKYYLALNYI
jgi:hypothetical protein